MPDPTLKVFVKKTSPDEINTVEQDSVKKKVMVKVMSSQEKRAELQKVAQIRRDEIVRKKDSILDRNLSATGLSKEEYQAKQVSDAKKPDAQLDGLNIDCANKRGATKGSCTTGQSYKGSSLKDTK